MSIDCALVAEPEATEGSVVNAANPGCNSRIESAQSHNENCGNEDSDYMHALKAGHRDRT